MRVVLIGDCKGSVVLPGHDGGGLQFQALQIAR
jgi:hypothetical protein